MNAALRTKNVLTIEEKAHSYRYVLYGERYTSGQLTIVAQTWKVLKKMANVDMKNKRQLKIGEPKLDEAL